MDDMDDLSEKLRLALLNGLRERFDPAIDPAGVMVEPSGYRDYQEVTIVSDRFEDMDNSDRARVVFAALEAQGISAELTRKVTLLLGLTPGEYYEYERLESVGETETEYEV